MLNRLRNRIQFLVELLFLRGPLHRLGVVVVLVAAIALIAGGIVFAAGQAFPTFGEAVWWAFLRLTDPGYLGDDDGMLRRGVSAVVTLLGYVIFLGALVAIMTQWVQETMARLQRGLTPIAARDHLLVLGWTNRTAALIDELFRSEDRVRRLLDRSRSGRVRVVLLSEHPPAQVLQELRDHMGPLWERTRFLVRSGSPLRREHLERCDPLNAAVIIVPASDVDAPLESTVDGDIVKTLMTLSDLARDHDEEPPLAVVELMDSRKAGLAARAYRGPVEVVPGDALLARLIAQTVRHPGASDVYEELLGHEWGNEFYVRPARAFAGRRFTELQAAFSRAIPVGVVRHSTTPATPLLAPPPDLEIEADDRLVLIAESSRHADPDGEPGPRGPAHPVEATSDRPDGPPLDRVLVLGWNHEAPALLRELDGGCRPAAELDFVSLTPIAERTALLERLAIVATRTRVQHIEADFTSPSDAARIDPAGYGTVVLLASEWTESDASTDARTMLGYLVLQELLEEAGTWPNVVVELLDESNISLVDADRAEVLLSTTLMSHVLAQVALRRELRVVIDELLCPRGPEVVFRDMHAVVSSERPTFADIQDACAARGDVALGVRAAPTGEKPSRAILNPARSTSWHASEGAQVVLLAADPR